MDGIAPSRSAALESDSRFYWGPICKRGHEGIRYAKTAACLQCAKEAGRARPPGRKSGARYSPEQGARYRAANQDKIIAERRRRHERDRAARAPGIAARKSAQAVARAQREAARQAARQPRLLLSDEERVIRRLTYDRAKAAKRRAIKRGSVGGIVHPLQLAALLALQGGGCAYCGDSSDLHLDHIEPVNRGGRHEIGNLQWLCATHNMGKRDKPDAEYRAIIGITSLTPWDVRAGLLRMVATLAAPAAFPPPTSISPRITAIADGHSTYIGKPCPHGHSGRRYVTSSGCVECLADRKKRL